MMDLAAAFADIALGFSSMFGGPFYDGAVLSQAEPGHYDDDGHYVPGSEPVARPCKVQVDALSEAARAQAGLAEGEYHFIILAASLDGPVDTDARASVTDPAAPAWMQGEWLVSSLTMDPVGIGWVGKGKKA